MKPWISFFFYNSVVVPKIVCVSRCLSLPLTGTYRLYRCTKGAATLSLWAETFNLSWPQLKHGAGKSHELLHWLVKMVAGDRKVEVVTCWKWCYLLMWLGWEESSVRGLAQPAREQDEFAFGRCPPVCAIGLVLRSLLLMLIPLL